MRYLSGKNSTQRLFDVIDCFRITQKTPICPTRFSHREGRFKRGKILWLSFVIEERNMVLHSSAAVTLTLKELDRLQWYEKWLASQKLVVSPERIMLRRSSPINVRPYEFTRELYT